MKSMEIKAESISYQVLIGKITEYLFLSASALVD